MVTTTMSTTPMIKEPILRTAPTRLIVYIVRFDPPSADRLAYRVIAVGTLPVPYLCMGFKG
jgi:hypothetical protein